MCKQKDVDAMTRAIHKNCDVSLSQARNIAIILSNKGFGKLPKWHRINKKLPKQGENILSFYPQKNYGSSMVIDYLETGEKSFAFEFKYGKPTHWIPLPEPPEEQI